MGPLHVHVNIVMVSVIPITYIQAPTTCTYHNRYAKHNIYHIHGKPGIGQLYIKVSTAPGGGGGWGGGGGCTLNFDCYVFPFLSLNKSVVLSIFALQRFY